MRGALQLGSESRPLDLMLDGVACERLGWVNFYDKSARSVIAFDPGVRALAVGDYAMGSSRPEPSAWLNTRRAPGSVMTFRGTTRLTSVTPNEVAGMVDWVIALPNDTLHGLTVRGAFRALRTGDACMPH